MRDLIPGVEPIYEAPLKVRLCGKLTGHRFRTKMSPWVKGYRAGKWFAWSRWDDCRICGQGMIHWRMLKEKEVP